MRKRLRRGGVSPQDYVAGVKGGSGNVASASPGGFGAGAFGATAATSPGAFGGGAFGQTAAAPSLFGQTAAPAGGGLFGAPAGGTCLLQPCIFIVHK